MFCSNCGNQILDGDRFCAICGHPVEPAAPAAAAPEQPVIPQTTPVMPAAEPTSFHFPTSAPVETPATAPATFHFPTSAPVESPTVEPAAFHFPTSAPVGAPPVMEQAPVAAPEAAPTQPVKKKKGGKIFLIISLVVLVLAAAAAAFLLLGKKTVYVLTKDVTENESYTMSYRYNYDKDGRIEKIVYEHEYANYDHAYGWEISYEYDNDGNLESAKLKSDEETIKVTYVYDDDILSGIKSADLVAEYNASKLKASCDDEGRFKRIAFLDSSGNEIRSWEFKYHDNGVIKKSTFAYTYAYSYYDYNYKYVSEYNEDGKLIEQTMYNGDTQYYRYTYDYDKKGNLCLQEQYDEADKLTYRMKIDSTYKLNKLDALSLTVENRSNDDTQKVQIIFDCEWSGKTCTLTVDKVKGDEELLDDVDIDGIEITFEIDKHGNLLEYEVCYDDEVVMSRKSEYEAVKIKRRNKKSDISSNPLYLYFLFNV